MRCFWCSHDEVEINPFISFSLLLPNLEDINLNNILSRQLGFITLQNFTRNCHDLKMFSWRNISHFIYPCGHYFRHSTNLTQLYIDGALFQRNMLNSGGNHPTDSDVCQMPPTWASQPERCYNDGGTEWRRPRATFPRNAHQHGLAPSVSTMASKRLDAWECGHAQAGAARYYLRFLVSERCTPSLANIFTN